MTRTIGMAIAAAVLAVAPGAFAQQRGVTPTEVTFGMHTDLSGVAATYGVSSSNGVKMRFDEINEGGGIEGRKLKVIVEDQGYQVSPCAYVVGLLDELVMRELGLRERGLVDAEGKFTPAGRETRSRIEALTDALAAPAYDCLQPHEIDQLTADLEPLVERIATAGY